MLKQGTFIRRKYRRLYAGSLFGSVAIAVNTLLDSVLSGNQLGETALTAVAIVAPLAFVACFFATITAPGFGILYGRYNGAFDTENAYKTAGQSLITAVLIGLLLSLVALLIKEPFLRYYGCTGALYENASAYYSWSCAMVGLLPVSNLLYYLVAADGDTLLLSLGGIGMIGVNIISSTVLCRFFGISGLGMGSVLSITTAAVVYSLHLLKKTNSIHFKFSFRWKLLFSAVRLSSAIGCSYLFVGLTDIIMNKVIQISCGASMVAAYSVINLVYGLYDVYSAPLTAADGLASTFLGERNNNGIRTVAKISVAATVGQGIVLSLLLSIFAPYLPGFYGIETPALVEASTNAARIMALAAIPYGIAYFSECFFPVLGKAKFGLVMTFLNDFFCPLALSIPLAYLFGFTGVSFGMALNGYLVLGLFALFLIVRYGKKGFPLYLTDYGEETVSFDLKVMPESIAEVRDKVARALCLRGYEIENIALLLEELFGRIYEKNPGKTVLAECVLLFGGDYVRIVVRDDGVVFNFVDENNKIESINAHTLNCLLEQVQEKEYILTTSFNRNGFVFQK